MFEDDGLLYYPTLIYFGIVLPFAIFFTVSSFYYFFKWLFSREKQLLKAAAYCFVDGIISLAFASVGIWLVVQQIGNLWIILLVGLAISPPYIFIARKFRNVIFYDQPRDTDSPTSN